MLGICKFLAVFLVTNMRYKFFKGFSLSVCNFSPWDSCLSSTCLNFFHCTSVLRFFSQIFSLVRESFKVVGPEAFVFLHSSSWDTSFSAIDDAAVDNFATLIWML